MEHPAQPGAIAREAIKRLAARKQPPTPENFRRAYLEVSGQPAQAPVWPQAIRDLLRHWDDYQAGLTQAKKRDMLERVLINFGSDQHRLADKLAALARGWGEAQASAPAMEADAAVAAARPGQSMPMGQSMGQDAAAGASRLAACIAANLQAMASGCSQFWPDLASRSQALAEAIAGAGQPLGERHVDAMGDLWREVLLRAEDDLEYLNGLKRLLALLFENVALLVAEDAWLSGQMTAMQAALSGDLTSHALFEAERSLQEVVHRQQALKGSLGEARDKLKQLIATFIARMGEVSASTGDYHGRIQGYSEQIAQAEDINQLSEVIDGLSADVLRVRDEMAQSHAELLAARQHVEEAEQRIHALEEELETVASQVRVDQLTGALNRRGMDEAFVREIARARRHGSPLSVALLDLDHFKRLNDMHGHQAGDQALVHLARVMRALLRPTDVLARYGGEEFLVLLPDTQASEGQRVMQRLQRQLTKEYFLHANQRVLITFSAGVAELLPGEARDALVARADAAMYRAKASGRNRVELA